MRDKNQVIALGGGAVVNDDNWQIIFSSGITVLLTAHEEVLFQRIIRASHRPLMFQDTHEKVREQIHTLLIRRLPYYRRAHYVFENNGELTTAQMAEKIYQKLVECT